MNPYNYIIPCFLSILFFSNTSIGQVEYTFIGQNKIWSEMEMIWDDALTNKYKFGGDSIVGEIIYQKAFYCYNDSLMQNWKFYGLFREDSIGRVFLHHSEGNDELKYDFMLVQGDSIYTGHSIGGNPVFAKVDSIGSIEINGEFRKKIIFEEWFDEFWIEGIGSSLGPFKPFEKNFSFDISWELICLEENMELIYQHPNFPTCFVSPSDIAKINYDPHSVKITPNPSSDYVDITIGANYISGLKISIYNSNSHIIFRRIFRRNHLRIETNLFDPGVYLLTIESVHGITATKLIVI